MAADHLFHPNFTPARVRWPLAILTLFTTALAVWLFYRVAAVGGVNPVEWLLIPLFAVLFVWIAFSFWTATLGMGHALRTKPAPRTNANAPLTTRIAVLMPVYNECPIGVFSRIQAMLKSLGETGEAAAFDVFVLSDTTDPNTWLAEEQAWGRLVADHRSAPRVFYRRRPFNHSRKAGNIADFCTRWGAGYDFMIVLDADSVMEGNTLIEMARRMQADPQLGILQVPPTPVNRVSLFARLQQFASRMYGAVFTQGFACWAQFDSNYWGHNAIIRVEPFTQCCTLPLLPGKAPLGGEILSHDFVEAALLAKAGWKVGLACDLGGSYEECPTTLLDYAKRDQRWCQGNMQHIRLIFSEGFRPISRLHLATGVMAYVASPLWLLFMTLSAVAIFLDGPSPTETMARAGGAGLVFALCMALLLLPKLWSLIAIRARPELLRLHGGWSNAACSVILETLLSVLMAPLMMVFHTQFVVGTLMGKKVQWSAQQRSESGTDLATAIAVYLPHTLLGIGTTVLLAVAAPSLLIWFSPVLLGLIVAIPLSMTLDSIRAGQALARRELLLIPEETETPSLLVSLQEIYAARMRQTQRFDASKLFDAVLSDPSFHALHRNILHATESNIAASPEDVEEAFRAIEQFGAEGVSTDLRRRILSDSNALRTLHIRVRAKQNSRPSPLSA